MEKINYRQLMRHEDVPRREAVEDRPSCHEHDYCPRCPYPAHGFVCWGNDNCMRKHVLQLSETRSLHYEKK